MNVRWCGRVVLLALVGALLGFSPGPARATPASQTDVQASVADLLNRAVDRARGGDYQAALAEVNQALQLNPSSWEAYGIRGDIRLGLQDLQGAIDDFSQALRINPNSVPVYLDLATALQRRGDLEGALRTYDQALRIDANNPSIYYRRAGALSTSGDRQAAIADYSRAIELNPNYSFAYLDRGVVRSALGDTQGAMEDYTRALQINPNYALAYHNRGRLRVRMGDLQGAIDDFTQALQLDPGSGAYYSRGLARARLGDHSGATADYTQALRFDANSSRIHESRGLARYRLGDDPGAIEDYTQALRLGANDATLYYNRALARGRLGDDGGAIEDYGQALQLNPNYANAAYNRGQARARQGDTQQAVQDLERAAALYAAQGDTASQQRALNAARAAQSGPLSAAAAAPGPAASPDTSGTADAPRAGEEPTRTLAVVRPLGSVLYQDNFTDPASGWPREPSDPESRLIGYQDGEYYVRRLVTRPGWDGVWRTREGFTDFQVEVDARLVSPTEGAFVFLGFRRQQNGEHYAFEVDPDDGTYRLQRHVVSGSSTTLIGRTRSAAIQAGTATNRLGARAHDTDIVLLINGLEVGRVRDDQFRQGALTLGVGRRGEGAPVEGRFSDLILTSMD